MTEGVPLPLLESGVNVKQSLQWEESRGITLSWEGVNVFCRTPHKPAKSRLRIPLLGSCTSSNGKEPSPPQSDTHILQDVSGVCRPGELLAVLGSSGAGKTTLLDVLTQRIAPGLQVSGDIHLNGSRVTSSMLASCSAYVQQDDLFSYMLTVREQLIFQAMLRMARHLTYEERLQRVTQVITELGLVSCQHTPIGELEENISGGERKRLSFACEILTNPLLMFCDEPTSGLDSFMAESVVAVLKKMAHSGRTIITTIHQPSSVVYATFDRILLLAEGRVAFLGTAAKALQFFTSMDLPCPTQYNPAEHFLDQLSVGQTRRPDENRRRVAMLCDAFRASKWYEVVASDVKANQNSCSLPVSEGAGGVDVGACGRYKSPWAWQLRWVVWRAWWQVLRQPRLIRVRFSQIMLLAMLMLALYGGQEMDEVGVSNINGLMYTIVSNMSVQNISTVIHTFTSEHHLIMREHHRGMYRPLVYFLAHSLVQAPVYTIATTLYAAMIYHGTGLDPDLTKFVLFILVVVLSAWAGVSFGYLLSCVFSSLDAAMNVYYASIFVPRIVCGYYMNVRSIPKILKWVQYFSWFWYGFEGLEVNQWTGISNITCTHTSRCYPDGQAVLTYLGLSRYGVGYDILGLVILVIFYRVIAFWFFLLKIKRHQMKTK